MSTIVNPATGRRVSTTGAIGKRILAEQRRARLAADPVEIKRNEDEKKATIQRNADLESSIEAEYTPIIQRELDELLEKAKKAKMYQILVFSHGWIEIINKYTGFPWLVQKVLFSTLNDPKNMEFIDMCVTVDADNKDEDEVDNTTTDTKSTNLNAAESVSA